jgi:hypothetical protein
VTAVTLGLNFPAFYFIDVPLTIVWYWSTFNAKFMLNCKFKLQNRSSSMKIKYEY